MTDSSRARARVGSVVAGKYKLAERLGGGGMGEVYRAEHLYAGRIVALKLLRRDFADDADLTRRFFQEAQAANKIRHPNIVDVLDAGVSEEGPYVAMELLEGESLSACIARRGKLDVATAIAVLLPMLDALDAAHRIGIVHRDLKPENVFLARTGPGSVVVKLLDFGIAKVLGTAKSTNTGVVFGTPDYLSPEQASGDGVVDGRSDLFAAGIVLFELVTGKRPFEAETAVATAYKIVHVAAPRLEAMGIALDPRVQDALDAAMAKSIEERCANAAGFADMLAAIAPDGAARRAALDAAVGDVGTAPTMTGDAIARAMPTQEPRDAPPVENADFALPIAPTLASPMGIAEQIGEGYARITPATRTPPTLPAPNAPLIARSITTTPIARASVTPVHTPTASRAARSSPTPPVRTSPTPRPSSVPTVRSSAPPRVTTRENASWRPRPLPAHVRGKAHVRGSVIRAAKKWIDRTQGGGACDGVLAALPKDLGESFGADAFNALVWYDAEALDAFLEGATALLLHGDATGWRALAREHFEADLASLFRTATRATDPAAHLKRTAATWARLFDFANARVSDPSRHTTPGETTRASIRFDGFDAASLALRNVVAGTAEGLARSAGARDARARILTGEASFSRDFEIEIAWSAR